MRCSKPPFGLVLTWSVFPSSLLRWSHAQKYAPTKMTLKSDGVIGEKTTVGFVNVHSGQCCRVSWLKQTDLNTELINSLCLSPRKKLSKYLGHSGIRVRFKSLQLAVPLP